MHKYHIYNTPVIEGIMHQGIEYEMEEKQKKLAVEIQKTGGDSWEGEFQELCKQLNFHYIQKWHIYSRLIRK